MCRHGAFVEQAEATEIRHRAAAVLSQAALTLSFGLGQMDVEGQPPPRGELPCPAERILGNGVQRMRINRQRDSARAALELVEQPLDLKPPTANCICRAVDEHFADTGAYPHLHRRPCRAA